TKGLAKQLMLLFEDLALHGRGSCWGRRRKCSPRRRPTRQSMLRASPENRRGWLRGNLDSNYPAGGDRPPDRNSRPGGGKRADVPGIGTCAGGGATRHRGTRGVLARSRRTPLCRLAQFARV